MKNIMFKRTYGLTMDEKYRVGQMSGKIMTGILEGRSDDTIGDSIGLPGFAVENNIDEMLYTLRRRVGLKRYLKILFMR